MPANRASHDALGQAVRDLRQAAQENLTRTQEILDRLDRIEARLAAGDPVTDVVVGEPAPRIVEMLSLNMVALETRGADFRVAQARSLHDEGMTMDVIAELFGVSRQRISALLR